MTRQLQNSTAKFERVNRRLLQNDLRPQLQKQQRQLQQTQYHLQNMITSLVNSYRQRFAVACSKMEAVSPLATLARGFSISETAEGTVLKKPAK